MKRLVPVLAGLVSCGGPAAAVDREIDVVFEAGRTSREIQGSIRRDDGVVYKVATVQGQTMQILFKPSNRSCAFNVYAPGRTIGTDSAAFIGSTSGNEYGVNPTEAGVYRVQVYLMRNAARRNETCRYTLSLEITGKPGGISAGVSDRAMRDACKGSAAPMFGVQPRRVIVAGKVTATPDGGFALDGTVDKGREGVKKLRCLYKPDRQFSHVQAMTPDGE
jgi:hypothetical protein